ncbi:MAG: beta-glucosidase [Chloroflexi bacterium]|nr:beta-glucosidase [Chloroflexota bacterium]
MNDMKLPSSFLWGTATSSYQIEGAVHEEGRGESIWDRFSHTPGKIQDGSNGDIACDHYHRWRQDVALMKELGLQAYRFSIAWPRILPDGHGQQLNQAGVDFYSRLVDELLAAGITPFPTLYHWDLPQPLQDRGGWPARATAQAFVDYADAISRALGDRVHNWITHNEPWCASMLGHQIGEHAPGWHDWPAALGAAHHLLLSHGWAVPVIRRNSPGAEVGITLNLLPVTPATDRPEDIEAARRFDGYFNRWFVDPLFKGSYPPDMVVDYIAEGHLPASGPEFVQSGDMAAISVPTDFLGVNYYSRAVVSASGEPTIAAETLLGTTDVERTEMGWEVYPQGLYELLTSLHADYNPGKLYITENGASYSDGPGEDGKVHDERRLRYLRDHFTAAQRAIESGVPLAGYFVWSLLDNFEWAKGYKQRFGLVWVDYETQQRIPKDSALWYKQVIAAHKASLDTGER